MLSPFLCAALALAAPADEPPDTPSILMSMELYPRRPMLGDVAIIKITAVNIGKEAQQVPQWFNPANDRFLLQPLFQICGGRSPRPLVDEKDREGSYCYYWMSLHGLPAWNILPAPLPPGEKRVVYFNALELPQIRDMRRDFWADLVKEKRPLYVRTYLSREGRAIFRPSASFKRILSRPKAEVAALVEAYTAERPKGHDEEGKLTPAFFGLAYFPAHMATPERLTALEAKLSDGTLRDILRATRLLQIVVANKDHPRGAAERRAAAKQLIALLNESAELERQWLAYGIFSSLYSLYGYYEYRRAESDEIEWELMKSTAEEVPDFMMNRSDWNAISYAEGWSILKQKRETKTTTAE